MNGNPEEVEGLPIPLGSGSHPNYAAECIKKAAAQLVGSTPDYGIEVPPPAVKPPEKPEKPVAQPK